MNKIVSANLGSIATQLHSLVEDIPTEISGTQLLALVDRKRLFMESFTGESIGSVGIADKYQPALLHLSASDLLGYMETLGADVSSISLGDFSESRGGASNTTQAREYFEKIGNDELKVLGRKIHFGKSRG